MDKFILFISDNFLAVLFLLSLITVFIVYERKKGGTKVCLLYTSDAADE